MPKPPRVRQAVIEALRRDLASGAFSGQPFLPGENALAQRHGASRPTIRMALQQLMGEGLVQSRPGLGWELAGANPRPPAASQRVLLVMRPNQARQAGILATLRRNLAPTRHPDMLHLAPTSEDIQLPALIREQGLAGMILVGGTPLPAQAVKALQAMDTPVALIGIDDPRSPFDTFGFDNRAATATVLRHLAKTGHRHVLMVGCRLPDPSFAARLQAAAELAPALGLHLTCQELETNWISPEASRDLLATVRKKHIDAIVGVTDTLAVGAIAWLAMAGVNVPGKLSAVGFGADANPEILTIHGLRRLASIRYPWGVACRHAVAQLAGRLAGKIPPPPRHRRHVATWYDGDSVACRRSPT